MKTIYLPNGFELAYDYSRDEWMLHHLNSRIYHRLQPEDHFPSLDAWFAYVERTANVIPETFTPALSQTIGDPTYGQHRQAASSHHSSPANVASPGPRGSPPGSSAPRAILSHQDAYDATCAAIRAGTIHPSDAQEYYEYLMGRGPPPTMTHPALSPSSALGAGYAATQAQITRQQYNALQAATAYGLGQYISPSMGVATPPHDRTALKSEGLHPGEIIAWRAWKVHGTELVSMTASSTWDPFKPMSGDAAGGWGIHAYKDPAGILYDGYISASSSSWVLGRVALWGDVIEHEHGYRAALARVHSLEMWSNDISADVRKIIEAKYVSVRVPAQDDKG